MATGTSDRTDALVKRHFAEVRSFDQQQGAYSALPWIFRSLLVAMNPRQWMLLTLLYLRSGPRGLSWQTDQELADNLGIGRKKVGPNLRALENLGFVSIKRVGRQRFVMLVDPMVVAEALLRPGSVLSPSQKARLADDLDLVEGYRGRTGKFVA